MSRSKALAQRRKELVVRSTVQRTDLLADRHLLRHAMTPTRIGGDVLDVLREHKMVIVGTVLAVIVLRPWRIVAGLKTAAVGWQAMRNVMPLLQNVKGLLRRS